MRQAELQIGGKPTTPAADGPSSREEDASAGSCSWRPTPLSALSLPRIPTEQHFVRDHFPPPAVDPATWSLELQGRSQARILDLEQLKRLASRTLTVVLECAGHRRAEFDPIPSGLPWGCGAVAEARWTGVSLATLLELVDVPRAAREVVLEGADAGRVDGFEGIHRFARSLPLAKAYDRDVLLAYEMNGAPLTVERGGPVRAIVPGWYATDSVKWIERIWFTEREFGGVFQAHDYRLQAPGEPGPGRRMTVLPPHALITHPAEGDRRAGSRVSVRGVAWGGSGGIREVLLSADHGQWQAATLAAAGQRFGLVHWEHQCTLSCGPHELACRAVDGAGQTQPADPPANVRGYGNNAVHRVQFTVA